MNAAAWAVLVLAAASAGTYCGAIASAAVRGTSGPPIPLAPILTATALFAFSRVFASSLPLSLIAALFLVLAAAQVAAAKGPHLLKKALSLVPLAAMLLVAVTQLAGTPAQIFQDALAATLCLPAPMLAARALGHFYLIRKAALDRVR